MRTPPVRLALALLAILWGPAVSAEDWGAVTGRQMRATVRVQVGRADGLVGGGSGAVVATREGKALILTCAHIFEHGGGTVTVFRPTPDLTGEPVPLAGRLLLKDPGGADLAAVECDAWPGLVPCPTADDPEAGQECLGAGYPGGGPLAVRAGRATAERFGWRDRSAVGVTFNPAQGMSGGPVFRRQDGKHVGVIVWQSFEPRRASQGGIVGGRECRRFLLGAPECRPYFATEAARP